MTLGKLEIQMQKNEMKPVSITLHKTHLQMDQRPKPENWKF